MFDTISCEADHLTEMYKNRYIHKTIMNSNACVEYGLDFLTIKKTSRRKISLISDQRKNFILSIFPKIKVAALCNTLAIVHKTIVLNKAKRVYISDDLIINLQTISPNTSELTTSSSITKSEQFNDTSSTIPIDSLSSVYLSSSTEPSMAQVVPTKTILNTDKDSSNKYVQQESTTTIDKNVTYVSDSSFIEPNSTNKVPVLSTAECKI